MRLAFSLFMLMLLQGVAMADIICSRPSVIADTMSSGTGTKNINVMEMDSQGNTYIAGGITGTVNFGQYSLSSASSVERPFLAKIAPDGSVAWARDFPASKSTQITDIAPEQNGYVFVTGPLPGTVDFDGRTVRDSLSFFARIESSDGSVKWSIGENHGSELQLLATTMLVYTLAGNEMSCYYLSVGSYQSAYSGLLPNPGYEAQIFAKGRSQQYSVQYNAANTEAIITQFDFRIQERWSVTVSCSESDFISSVAIDENLNPIVTGRFSGSISVQGQTYTANCTDNLFALSLSADGTAHSLTQAAGAFNLGASPDDAIIKYSDGRFVVMQSYQSGDVVSYGSYTETISASSAAVATVFDQLWNHKASHILETDGSVNPINVFVLPTDTVQASYRVQGDATLYNAAHSFSSEEIYLARIGEGGLILRDIYATGSGSDPANTCITIDAISSQPITYTWDTGMSGTRNCGLTPGDYSITIDDGLCSTDTIMTISRNGGNSQYLDDCHELSMEWGNVITCDQFMDKDGLRLTADGSMLITGVVDGTNWVGNHTLIPDGDPSHERRAVLIKYAADGAVDFALDIDDFGRSLDACQAPDGTIYALAAEQYPGTDTYVFAFDATGTELSRFQLNSTTAQWASMIKTDKLGNLLISTDTGLQKYSPAGVLLVDYPMADANRIQFIEYDGDGFFYVCNHSKIFKFTTDLQLVWQRQFDAYGSDFNLHYLSIESDSEIAISGTMRKMMSVDGSAITQDFPDQGIYLRFTTDGKLINYRKQKQEAFDWPKIYYGKGRLYASFTVDQGNYFTYQGVNEKITEKQVQIFAEFDRDWNLIDWMSIRNPVQHVRSYKCEIDQYGVLHANGVWGSDGDVVLAGTTYPADPNLSGTTFHAKLGKAGMQIISVDTTGTGAYPASTCMAIKAVSPTPITYTWSNGMSGSQNCGLTPGTYTVTVDNGYCSKEVTMTFDGSIPQPISPCEENDFQWINTIYCESFIDKEGLEVTNRNETITFGALRGDNYFGQSLITAPAGYGPHDDHPFVALYNQDGSLQYVARYETRGAGQNAMGEVIIYTGSSIASLDRSGNLLWDQPVTGVSTYYKDFHVDSTGNIWLLTKTEIVKFDATGNELNRITANLQQWNTRSAVDAKGNLYVLEDSKLYKYDSGLNLLWSQSFSPKGEDYIRSISTNSGGGITLSGTLKGNSTFNGVNLVAPSQFIGFYMELAADGSVAKHSVMPENPSSRSGTVYNRNGKHYYIVEGDFSYAGVSYPQSNTSVHIAEFDENWTLVNHSQIDNTVSHLMHYKAEIGPDGILQINGRSDKHAQFDQKSLTPDVGSNISFLAKLAAPKLKLVLADTTGDGSDPAQTCIDIQATSANPVTYTWSNGMSGTHNCGLQTGKYTITVDDGQCSIDTTFEFGSLPVQVVTQSIINSIDSTLCMVDTLHYSAPAAQQYTWSTGDTVQNISIEPNTLDTLVWFQAVDTSNIDTIFVWIDTVRFHLKQAPQLQSVTPHAEVCSGDSILIEVDAGYDQYAWSNGSDSSSAFVSAGTYYYTVTNMDNCTVTDSIIVTEKFAPASYQLPNDTLICQGDSLLISGPVGTYSYSWNTGDTVQSVYVQDSGLYILSVQEFGVQNSCAQADTFRLGLNLKPELTMGNDTAICTSIPWSIAPVSNANDYVWSTGATTSSIFADYGSNTYTVTVTGVNGCSAVDSIAFSQNKPYDPISVQEFICSGDILVGDSAIIADTYRWSTGDTTQFFTAHQEGEYWLHYTLGACTDSTLFNYRYVLKSENLSLSNDTIIAKGDTLLIGATYTDSTISTAGLVKWQGYPAGDTIMVTDSGEYVVEVGFTSFGVLCAIYDTVRVGLLPDSCTSDLFSLPHDFAGADKLICFGDTTCVGVPQGYFTYAWSTGGNSAKECFDTIGTYTVSITDSLGCTMSDSVSVGTIEPDKFTVTNDTLVAVGDTIQLKAEYTGNAIHPYVIEWLKMPAGDSIAVSEAGRYAAKISMTVGLKMCAHYKYVNVDTIPQTDSCTAELLALPHAFAGKDATVCSGDSVTVLLPQAALDYMWGNGQQTDSAVFSKQGYYMVTATDSLGCTRTDTIAIVLIDNNLSLFPADTMYFCSGDSVLLTAQDSALWNNGTISDQLYANSEGWYWAELSKGNCSGRDSIYIAIRANNFPVLPDSARICQGAYFSLALQAPYQVDWADGESSPSRQFASSGNYKYQLSDGQCSSGYTLAVDVLPLPKVNLGSDTALYIGQIIQLDAGSGFKSYTWQDSSMTQTYHASAKGSYWVQVTDSFDCQMSDSIFISELVAQSAQVSASAQNICPGDSILLSASSTSLPIEWSTGDTAANIWVHSAGQYWLRTEPVTGIYVFSDTVQISTGTEPHINIGADTALCHGDALTLYAGNVQSAYWNTGETSTQIAVDTAGTYWVQVENAQGCRATDTINVSIIKPEAVDIYGETQYCYGDTVRLTTESESAVWYTDAGLMNQIGTGSELIISRANRLLKTVYCTGSLQGCNLAISSVSINVHPPLRPRILGETEICQDAEAVSYSLDKKYQSVQWNVSDGGIPAGQGDSTKTVEWGDAGLQQLTVYVKDEMGCTGKSQLQVTVLEAPDTDFDIIKLADDSVRFIQPVSEPDAKYVWDFGDGSDNSVTLTDTIIVYEIGEYQVSLWSVNEQGCYSETEKLLSIDIAQGLFVPTAFYPHSPSEQLQSFAPVATGLSHYQIWIYDQWGNTVWYSDKLINGRPAEAWSPGDNDSPVVATEYMWKIDARFENGSEWYSGRSFFGKKLRTGRVLLLE